MSEDEFPLLRGRDNDIKLSSLSSNIHLLMTKLADSDISVPELAGFIRAYPAIALRLIALANSAWSAPLIPVTTLEQACSRLGAGIVKSVSIALAVSSHFNTAFCFGFRRARFWSTAMLTVEGIDLMLPHLPAELKSEYFRECLQTAGILHNLGLLWLAEHYPDATGEALRKTAADPALSLAGALRDILGMDYGDVGGWLGERLHIPEILWVPMRQHGDRQYRGPFWQISLAVGAAAKLANALQENNPDELFLPGPVEELALPQTVQQEIFRKLGARLPKIRELAELLFN